MQQMRTIHEQKQRKKKSEDTDVLETPLQPEDDDEVRTYEVSKDLHIVVDCGMQ